jgi:hypothetical protein
MKHLAQTVVVCLLMALALIAFCPSVKASVLPVVELDARDAVLALADGPVPVCVADIKDKGVLHTLVFPMECQALVPIFAEDQKNANKQAILYVTINGKHINLV